jgi:fumarate reductase flavoprotein subunit
MRMEGKFTVKAPIQVVWDSILKPEGLVSSVPGCEKVERIGENIYESVIKLKVGPVSLRFKLTTSLVDLDPQKHLRAIGSGEDFGRMGTVDYEAIVDLTRLSDDEVEVAYRSNVNVEGRLANFGMRIIAGKLKEVEEEFSKTFSKRLLGDQTMFSPPSMTKRIPGRADTQTDVLVVGGGTAGLPASIAACEAGAKVLIIEKRHTCLDCAGALCGGMMSFAGTDLQKEFGIEDSSDLYYRDMVEYGTHENIPKVVKAITDKQLDAYDWLRKLGVRFYDVHYSPGMSAPRAHITEPTHMIEILQQTAESKGVEILFDTRAKRLMIDKNGQVVGVQAERNGTPLKFKAKKGVILTCGGFGQNPEWLERCRRGFFKVSSISAPGATGDGFSMALAVGADLRGIPWVRSFSSFHVKGESITDMALLHSCGAIYVNKRGKRFVNEASDHKIMGDILLQQTDSVGFQILDRKVYQMALQNPQVLSPQAEALLVKDETVEGLAVKIGIDSAALKDTVDKYNSYVEAGSDPEFGRTALYGTEGRPTRIDTPPFYAFESTSDVHGTAGTGFVIDENSRAINVFGEVIPRLYLCGEMAFGWLGPAPVGGTSTVGAIVQGLIAGRNAAAEKPISRKWMSFWSGK